MKIARLVYDDQVPSVEIEKEALGEKGVLEIVTFNGEKGDFEELAALLAPFDGIVTDYVPLGKAVLSRLPNCKVISVAATGWTSVDAQACRENGVTLCALGDYCTQEVADHAMLLLLALERRLMILSDSVQNKKAWNWLAAPDIERIEGKTLGIVGFGRIGRAVAARAKAFGLNVVASDPFVPKEAEKELGVELAPLEDLLSASGYVSIHMAVDESNAGSFDYAKFKLMAKKPFFINVSRGAAVNEPDLIRALDEGLISGAAVDVLSTEDPDLASHPLAGRPNVILTPHVAFYSKTSMLLNSKISMENAIHVLEGRSDLANKIVAKP